MKTDLLFAVPEFLSNPYFSVGFFIFMCVFAFLWAMSAPKVSNSELDLSVREALMAELQSKLNFVNSALELSKRNESQNEAVIKSLRHDLSQEISKFSGVTGTLQNREEIIKAMKEEIAEVKAAAAEVLVNGMEGWTSVPTPTEIKTPSEFKAAKVPAKRASKPVSKSKSTTKPRSLGVED